MEAPSPFGPVPSRRQLDWASLELYGFIHFTLNTFTGREWGTGAEDPSIFAPSSFDADAIAGLAAEAGLGGLILTAKHHDGFCLWPSAFTRHSVAASPWRDGKGDLVAEMSAACARAGIRFGVYLSPWDRNHADYGREAYIEAYFGQLRELLTNYGPLFEVWFDGANGGSGYYGGANETRRIDRATYYPWERIHGLVRELQPGACIFGDGGPDLRWVGNEKGVAGDPCWARFDPEGVVPGIYETSLLNRGVEEGPSWIPAECDVSIRPGWFWHRAEDLFVKSPRRLRALYRASVGRGASMLLNLPPDREGRIGARDRASLLAFGERLRSTFSVDLARGAKVTASDTRLGLEAFSPFRLTDGDPSTYWATNEAVHEAECVLEFEGSLDFDGFSLREAIELGQRVTSWTVESRRGGRWRSLASGQSIGMRRLWKGRPCRAEALRLRLEARAPLAMREFALHRWR